MLCWGVTFGNFSGIELKRLIASVKSYDMACFTVDHNLDVTSLAAAYDNAPVHSLIMGPLEYVQSVIASDGVTSVSGFDVSAWTSELAFEEMHHDARGLVDELRVVCYVRSCREQTLVFQCLAHGRRTVQIADGERFEVVQSRKYSVDRVRYLLDQVPSERP